MELKNKHITIIGAGNLGLAITKGLLKSGLLQENKLTITKRKLDGLDQFVEKGIRVTSNNKEAAAQADIILLAVQPQQLSAVIEEIKDTLTNKLIISTLTGVKLHALQEYVGDTNQVVRAMPNTALAVQQSMTCISSNASKNNTQLVESIFAVLGKTIVIEDELMQAATVMGASGIAFWLRLVRATTQGGVQLGFDAPEAQKIAVQTCLGAASLLQNGSNHPESEIDKVTTPKGCTISGLNEMEHQGLSSALIQGLVTSFKKINEI
ncbi:MAG: pyrroline-5-carboxylate reductase [Cyclobacteriaceae bacterium]|nr:pyrroline-5-carboxylate reductase [Cyclobacteriaceae bacterium]